MILRSRDLTKFELRVVGYQFAGIEGDEWDANWLVVDDRVVPVDERAWEFSDPALLTWEVERLSNWLDALASGQAVDDSEDFVEPNLRFEVVGRDEDIITIRIYFELETRAPWFFAREAGMNDLWVVLLVDSDDLRAAASSLRGDLAKFPPRQA